jgi:hypothetical protein
VITEPAAWLAGDRRRADRCPGRLADAVRRWKTIARG